MQRILPYPLLAGACSALIFMVLGTAQHSLLLIFSAIPLCLLGSRQNFASVVQAAMIAALALVAFHPLSSLFYIALVGVPAFFLCAHRLRGRDLHASLSDISLYMIILCGGVEASMRQAGGIGGWIHSQMAEKQLAMSDPKMAQTIEWLTSDGSYLLVGMIVWWMMLFLLLSSWLAELLESLLPAAASAPDAPRMPYFTRGGLPGWLLLCLLAAMAGGFLASENIRFISLLSFVIILLPYFFYGAIYTPLRNILKNQLGWSLIICVVMLLLVWPALLCAALGVFKHTQLMLQKPERAA